jgi:outer membrane lipase/esterase
MRTVVLFRGVKMMQQGRRPLLALLVAGVAVLAGCGGGDDEAAAPRVPISRVVVAGDSLADVGTFGFKFTVQNSADPVNGFPVFPEIVAQNFGVNRQCSFFLFNGTTFVQNPTPACTNFAVGASRIQNPASQGGAAGPQSIPLQLATAAQAVGGSYSASDLVLVDGGGNDAGDLLAALIGGAATYQAFLAQQLDAATIAGALAQPDGSAVAAVLYMRRLADVYYNAVRVNALDKGATHVAVLDMPDITRTPRVRAALAQVAQARGAETASALEATLRAAIDAFNGQLRADVGNDTRVVVSPFNADFTEEVTHPVDFALSDVSTPACAVVGVTSFGDARPCTSAALDANPPAGLAPGWWRSWTFSDGFHPTPYGHRLLAASTSRAIARAGWL